MNECQHWSATCTSLGGWSLTYREQSLTIWLVSGSPVDKDQESNGISKSQTRRHSGRSESGSKSSSPKNDASLQAFFFFSSSPLLSRLIILLHPSNFLLFHILLVGRICFSPSSFPPALLRHLSARISNCYYHGLSFPRCFSFPYSS